MNMIKTVVSSAIICGLAAPAVASASSLCRTFWPETVTQCQSNLDNANGSGLNFVSGGNNRRVTVNWTGGTVKAQAAPLDSNGVAITACRAEDLSLNSGPAQIKDCFTANPPVFFFVTGD